MIGEKYVIEIAESREHKDDFGRKYTLYRIKGFNSLVFDNTGLHKLEKYKDYEKALDKACGIISQFDKQLNDEFGGGYQDKEEWKERITK